MSLAAYELLSKLVRSNQYRVNYCGLEVVNSLNPPATEIDFNLLPEDFVDQIPRDYINLLFKFNGFTIFNFDWNSGFEFFGTDKIFEENTIIKFIYEDNWNNDILVFGKVIGSADFIGFRKMNNNYEILDCCVDDLPKDFLIISNSLVDFFNGIIESKGESFWLK